MEASPTMKRAISQAIAKAQKKLIHTDGVYYLDFYREMDSSDLPDQFMDLEIQIEVNLIDLIKNDEVYISQDVTQFSLRPLESYRKWSDLMINTFKGYMLSDVNVF